ncbi:MAG TPA: biotin/lipoyl-binding protein, partial [Pedococcus sp.]|nr:biotin/lipoyl-binding protein [Pedococcus sp.]
MARRTPHRGARIVAAGVTVGVVLGGTLVARAMAASDPTSGDRTAVAQLGSVDQRLDLTGTVQQVDLKTAKFAVQGTVSSVAVTLGQNVTAGQVLARLDPADLQDAVTQARATLARAQESLAADESGTSIGSPSGSGSGAGSGSGTTSAGSALPAMFVIASHTGSPSAGPTPSTGAAALTTASAQAAVAAAEKGVKAAELQAQTAQHQAAAAMTAATTACDPVLGSSTSTSTPTPTGTGTPTPTTTTTPTSSPTGTSTGSSNPALAACLQALTTVRDAQATVATAQSSVSAAQGTLDGAELAWQKALMTTSSTNGKGTSHSGSTGSTSTSRTGSSGSTGSSRTGSTGGTTRGTSTGGSRPSASTSGTSTRSGAGSGSSGSSGSSAAATAGRIATDEASVTQAETTLGRAEADLADATLTAPTAGVVAAVGYTAGSKAGSTGISIVGPGGATVTVQVPVTSISRVAVGQQVNVTPPGSIVPVPGT